VTNPRRLTAPRKFTSPLTLQSLCALRGGPGKPFLATSAAIEMYGWDVLGCLLFLQEEARRRNGLDYLQVFEDPTKPEPLWFIEDGDGGGITALLPSDY
jgi:hypothetical protein